MKKLIGSLALSGAIAAAAGCDNSEVNYDRRPSESIQRIPSQVEVRERVVEVVRTPENPDNDGDGYTTLIDCDDNNPAIHPGATELCNRVDDNCNRIVDDVTGGGRARIFGRDVDGDGHISETSETVEACVAPEGFIAVTYGNKYDCDDTNPAIHPGAAEYPMDGTTIDGIDQNCDGIVDGGYTETIPTGIQINLEGVTIGGILDAFNGSGSVRGAAANVKYHLGDQAGLLNQIESVIYSDNALTRAILTPTIDANARMFVALYKFERDKVDALLSDLNTMLSYVRTADIEKEQEYYNSLAEDEKDAFIIYGPEVTERNYENRTPNREMQAMVFRRLRAGANREIIIWGLERAISQIEEGTRLVQVNPDQNDNENK